LTGILAAGGVIGASGGGGGGGFSAVADPSNASGSGPAGFVTSETVTCVVTGGTAPFSYLWSRTGGDVMSIISASEQQTSFVATVQNLEPKNATFVCTVTDATAATTVSSEVAVYLEAI